MVFDRQCGDIAGAAMVLITMVGVMDGMSAAPDGIWRKRQDTQAAPDPVLQPTVPQECAMSAIMQDDEDTHQKGTIQPSERQRKPRADGQCGPCKGPQSSSGTSVAASSNRLRLVEGSLYRAKTDSHSRAEWVVTV